jgi:hypothetical protein
VTDPQWSSNPDGPAKQLYDLLHQYIPTGTLERAVAMFLDVMEGKPGDCAVIIRAWRDATGCDTPTDARRHINQLQK